MERPRPNSPSRLRPRRLLRILVENARRKGRGRHGGGLRRVEVDAACSLTEPPADDNLLALDQELDRLAALDPKRAEVVKLRFFAGLTLPEAADAMGVSLATAERYWSFARTWLFAELKEEPPSDAQPKKNISDVRGFKGFRRTDRQNPAQGPPHDRPVRHQSIFLAALERPTPEARASYLDTACPDPEIRRHVERLLDGIPRSAASSMPPPTTGTAPAITSRSPSGPAPWSARTS